MKKPSINASSMADIAFLLLLFFLVTTTMFVDKGIATTLPVYVPPEALVNVPANDRNVLEILVNAKDELLVEKELIALNELRGITKKHINNHNQDKAYSISPDKAIVSIKNDRGTSYETYIAVQNEIRAAYRELRDNYADQQFNKYYQQLNMEQQKQVRQIYPLRISEAEPNQN